MTYYSYKLDKSLLHNLCIDTGRLSHVLRNYCQGYVNNNNPELLTLDNISNQIETQCREIRGHLQVNNEIKGNVIQAAKLAMFIKKILSEEFYDNPNLHSSSDKVRMIREVINKIVNFVQKIDTEVNKAILFSSEDIFKQKLITPMEGESSDAPCAFVENEFLKKEPINLGEGDIRLDQFREAITVMGELISNKSHCIQDEVTPYIHLSPLNETANKIIQISGGVENQGRALIAEIENQKPNINNLYKYSDSALGSIKQIFDMLNENFTLKEKRDSIHSLAVMEEDLLNRTKHIIGRGFKS